MELLVSLLILCLIMGLVYYVVTLMPLPEPFKTAAVIIVLVLFLIVLIGYLVPNYGLFPLRR